MAFVIVMIIFDSDIMAMLLYCDMSCLVIGHAAAPSFHDALYRSGRGVHFSCTATHRSR